MSNLPQKCLVDTNVPIISNRVLDADNIPDDLAQCVMACIEAVEHVIEKKGLVIDAGDEIFDEYRKHLLMSGQPGVGDCFMKWVHDNRWILPPEDRVAINKNDNSYDEFPIHDGLSEFDKSDRKFIAVANAHPAKPSILQATDSKWLGWNPALQEVGITIQFLCFDYIKAKYEGKFTK